MNKLLQIHQGKEKNGFWLLNPASKIESLLLTLFFLFLPTQLGKHFWPDFSVVSGIRIDYLSPTFYFTDLLLLTLFIAAGLRLFFTSSLRLRFRKSYFIVALIIIIFLVLNATFSFRPLLSLYGTSKYLELFLLSFYLARTIKRTAQIKKIALFFAISATAESLLAILQYIHQGSLNGIFYFFGERNFTGVTPGIANVSLNGDLILRPYATFPHPNVLAGYLLLAILFVWFFLRQTSSQWLQVFSAGSLLLCSIALLFTFSRFAIALWIILLSSILIRLLFVALQTAKQKLAIIVIILIGLVVVSLFPLSHELFARFAHTSFGEESVVERTELIASSFILLQQHPFLGVGLYNFMPALAPLQKPVPLGLYLQPVHNIFLLIATELGMLGFLFFLCLLMLTYQRILKLDKPVKNFLLLALSTILLTGMFDHYWLTLQQGQLLFAVILGLSWAKYQKSNH
ncbi:MAG: O-antigen ligase family protein [Candidatus Levyibacteriota bacterium]